MMRQVEIDLSDLTSLLGIVVRLSLLMGSSNKENKL